MTTPDLSTPRDLIAFLDFDGVISSPRAYVVQPELPRDHRWIDPVSCKKIAKLQPDYGFQNLLSSTWRGFGRDRFDVVLAPYGLDAALHHYPMKIVRPTGMESAGQNV